MRTTNDVLSVRRGASVGFGIQLGGKPTGHTDEGSQGLNLPFFDMVGYEDGQCSSQNTAS